MQMIRSVLSAGEPTALIQREVLTLSDDEKRALLDKAGISSTIEIGAAEILAIKAGLAIPWNKLRLLKVRHENAAKINNAAIPGGSNHQGFVWLGRQDCARLPAKLWAIS